MAKFDTVWQSLDATVASGWAPGIVAGVRHEGKNSFHATGFTSLEGTDPIRTTTPFRIASLSKLIGGTLAAMMIADGTLGTDDPVDRWLPELANPRVLAHPRAPLDQTVSSERPITIRHLLTMTNGMGFSFEPSSATDEIMSWGIGPIPPDLTPDDYMAKIASLPLAYQPGTRWMYHTGSDILGVLLARASGKPLHDLLRERITGPLGMNATDFWASGSTPATQYMPGPDGLVELTEFMDAFTSPPRFESLAGGLISTVEDYMTFLTALADEVLIPSNLFEQMTTDQLTSDQRLTAGGMLEPGTSWGWQTAVDIEVTTPWSAIGRFGWTGGSGTSAYLDPTRYLIGIVFTQRFMNGPDENFAYFWDPVVKAIQE
jgi:CubicO group peptidase (beta-lactamase class C family)